MFKKESNCNIHTAVIIVLLVIIAILSFFVGKNYNKLFDTNNKTNSWNTETVNIKVYDDKRCNNCHTDEIIQQLKLIPKLANANIEKIDFSDWDAEEFLNDNNITKLPAFIFENNQIDQSINQYLTELPSKEYSLQIWATYNPFVKRSEKWFMLLEKDAYEKIKANSYIKWNKDAKVTWLEYSDLECPYCAKLHTSWTPEELVKKYWENLNKIFNHFPLDFHKNALSWAEILECIWEQKWVDAFYNIIETSYKGRDITKAEDNTKNSSNEFLFAEAVKLWVNKDELQKCIDSWKYKEKITTEQKTWTDLFWIQWTPGNVLINNETLEYEIISWAYPTESFSEIIDKLLK